MKNYLKFWGTRGSCAVSGPEYRYFGGNTPCLEVHYEGTRLIIDAGTGIFPLGNTLAQEKKIDLFLSHTHWDHIIGLPFFEPLYHQGVQITLWAPRGEKRNCEELMKQLLAEEFFPVRLDQIPNRLTFKTIQEKTPVHIGPLTIDFHRTHHPGMAYCFKIKTPHQTIGYVTDNEVHRDQQSFIDFHKRADYFIHEAQYFPSEYQRKKGWGHSSLSDTIALVNQIKPSRWLVTHHDPCHTDAELKKLEAEARASSLPCPVEWVPDGHIVELK